MLKHIFIFQCEQDMWWKKAPFFRVLPGFITGIFLEWEGCLDPWSLYFLSVLGLFLLFAYRLSGYYRIFRLSWFSGAGMQLLFLVLGAILCFYRDPVHQKKWYGNIIKPGDSFLVRILDEPAEKINSFQSRALLICASRESKSIPAEGKILVYFKKQPVLPPKGSLLWINKPIDRTRNSGNPGEFDFKKYCKLQGITGSIYLDKKDFTRQGYEPPSWLNKILSQSQLFIRNQLKKWITGKKEYGLAEALLIGYRLDLDKDLSAAYANTGTVHIIAISGMHLALIYGLLMWLFRSIPDRGKIKWLRIIFLLVILWAFGLVCGAQPSILRATISFSFVLLGQGLKRRSSTLNALAGSAFILLCIDPYNLWDAGFQLSFAAITSILVFNRPIRQLFRSENRIMCTIYDLVAITVAAQILTFPISAFHFHQFPIYFLFSNLVAVPLSGIILVAEILLVFVSGIPLLAVFSGKLIAMLIRLMNTWIEKIGALPASTLQDIQINGWQLAMIYFFIFSLSLFLNTRNNKWWWSACLSVFILASIRSYHLFTALRQQRVIVYNLKGHSLVEYQSGLSAWSFFEDPPEFYTQLLHSRSFFGIREQKVIKGKGCFLISGKKLVMADKFTFTDQPLPLYLVLHGRASLETKRLGPFDHLKVILDNTVPVSSANRIERFCDSLHIPFHVVRKQGAFIADL